MSNLFNVKYPSVDHVFNVLNLSLLMFKNYFNSMTKKQYNKMHFPRSEYHNIRDIILIEFVLHNQKG